METNKSVKLTKAHDTTIDKKPFILQQYTPQTLHNCNMIICGTASPSFLKRTVNSVVTRRKNKTGEAE